MGPDLFELFEEGKQDDEIAAIIRLGHSTVIPKGVRVVTQFSEIITVRLKRGNIPNVSGAPEVASMIAGDSYMGPDVELESRELSSDALLSTDERRPQDESANGRGIVVGAVDWGFDFAHPDFRHRDGATRILALWDQREGKRPDSPKPFGYGVVHDREAINRALKEKDPYAALHYHPADADTGIGSHGTHVVSIAAGTGGEGRPVGIAPEADLVLVHNAPFDEEESGKLGDSVTLLEGLDFIARTAGDRPWVVNTSLGRHGEQHDGSTLIEQGFDAAITAAPGRAICMSAGNYFDKRIHASGQLRPTQTRTFVWEINQGPKPTDNNQLEVWYSWQDKFEAAVRSPDGSIVAQVKIGERTKFMVGGKEVGNVYHRGQEPNNLDNHIVIFLYKEAPAGAWEVTLIGDDVIDGRFHAWIEREVACPRCQSHFRAEDADPRSTTGTICNGRRTLAVGAFDNHDPEQRIGHFSSAGPSRDGRLKPDLCAPGVSVLAARSTPREKQGDVSLVTRMSGTSMAAPHVTGTVALMFQAAPRKLRIEETHNLLLENTRRVSVPDEIPDRLGIGFLDVREAVEAARRVGGTGGAGFRQTIVQTPAPPPRLQAQQAERVPKRFAGGEEERVPKRETSTAVAEAAPESETSEAQPLRQPCNGGRKAESERVTRSGIAALAIGTSDADPTSERVESYAERHTRESIESEDLIPVAGDCSSVAVSCAPDPTAPKTRPKGKPEGDFVDRTEGDRNVNFALQLFDYDINAYLPDKPRHREALARIRDFIVNRSVQTTENIAVTLTGAASRTGSAGYNEALSCKRAKCAAENLRASLSFFRGVLERVQINPAGEGFTHSTCRGSDCELGEWRSVLIQVHAPANPPKPIPVVDQGCKEYTIRCCSFHTQNVVSALLGELLKRGLPQIPDFLKGKLESGIEKGLKKLIEQLRKRLPKVGAVLSDLGELVELFPAEIIQETGTFEIAERKDQNARRVVLCYSGWGLRVLLPREKLDDFLDDALDKVGFLKALPDIAKKQLKEQIKKLIPDLLKTLIQPIDSDTPGPVARFDLRHPRKIGVFEGRVQIGKGIWMPGQVNVEFDSPPWGLPDPVLRPAIVACPDTDCNEGGVQTRVGDGKGLELFSISAGDLVTGSCVCAVAPAHGRESERIERIPAELVEVADQVVKRPEGRRPPVAVLHEILTRTGVAEALTVPGTGRLPSAVEIFDSFAYAAPSSFREQLEQQFEVVALPGAPLRSRLQEADVLVRRGDGDFAHVSVIASSELRDFETLRSAGMTPEISASGRYGHVIETGARPHRRDDQFARRVTESSGVLPQNTLVLRMRQPIAAVQSRESEAAFETSAQSSLHPDVEAAGKSRRNAGTAKNGHKEKAAAESEGMGEGFGRRLLEDLLLLKLATPTPTPAPTVVKVEAPGGSTTQSPPDFDSELSAEDELPCDHIDASQLSWPGASSSALDLMRRVYLRQAGAACRMRSFIADVPGSELADIENGITARRDAAESCRRLLEAARAALASDPAASWVSRIGVLSGYRSASQQLANWNRNFPRYYSETQADRAALAGGEFGDAAAALLTRYISLRLAAPGFSLHNDGRAVDFLTADHGRTLGADTHASNRAAWRNSWFFQWLTSNANSYGFFQNTSIDEPWHWEFRSLSETAPSQSIERISAPLPAPDTNELTESGVKAESAEAFPPGHRLELSQTPLLSSHRGTQPDLILRWNEAAESASTVDIAVHLHGYSSDRARMRLTNKEAYSGLDFSNPDSAGASQGRASATLGILPRGSYTGDQAGANPETYTFPALVTPTGIRDLISYSVQQFQTAGGLSAALSTSRLILTAHSGGGAALLRILANNAPDEIHVFDALYWDASPLISWVNARISSEVQAWTPGKTRAEGGLCILYRRRGTETQSLRVERALRAAIAGAPADAQPVLQAAYRVLRTDVAHGDIPRRFGWLLLADVGQRLDRTNAPAGEATVAEDDATQKPQAAADACPWWLPEDRTASYFSYAQQQTWGRATLLINGRYSKGNGTNDDRSEPFDQMQIAVESTNPGDAVYLASWIFDPATKLTKKPATGTWGDLIADRASKGVTFRILLNDFPKLMKWASNLKGLDELILKLPNNQRDNVKYLLSQHPAYISLSDFQAKLLSKQFGLSVPAGPVHVAVHHQKFMVVRYNDHLTAFCGGVDIIPGMTPDMWSKTPWRGWHDLQVHLEGPISYDIEKEFVWRWNRERGASRRPPLPGWKAHEELGLTPLSSAEKNPGVYRTAIQMLRTVSESTGDTPAAFATTRRGDVRQAYQHGIACAYDFLYFENQYFRVPELADWIVARGTERPSLIVIIVVVHSALAEGDDGKSALTDHGFFLQHQTFERLVTGLGAARVRFYEMHKRYVHAKLIFADDRWCCIGSANVNPRGFELDSELNVQMREPDPEVLKGFRKKLWAHNLGVSEAEVGTWAVSDFITQWDKVADANARKGTDRMVGEGILSFDYKKFPGKSLPVDPGPLASLGIPGAGSRPDQIA